MSIPIESDDDRMSALADGCLQGDDFALLMSDLSARQALARAWHAYHVIGDVLRSDDLACAADDLGFLTRFEVRLASEYVQPSRETSMPPPMVTEAATASANAPSFRWHWLSGIVVSALVSVVGIGFWNSTKPPSSAIAVNRNEAQIMIRDPQLDAFMAAHQQLGGHSALQMPTGFLRNATFERPAQ